MDGNANLEVRASLASTGSSGRRESSRDGLNKKVIADCCVALFTATNRTGYDGRSLPKNVHGSKRAQSAHSDFVSAETGSPASTAYVASSTREPSRELPPSRSAARSSLTTDLTTEERHDENFGQRQRRRKPSFISQERQIVLDSIDAELAALRPKLQGQTQKVARLKEEVKKAKDREQREARDQRINAAERQQRRLKLTSRLQAVVRGWLVRKRVIAALDHRTVHNMKWAAQLPDMLKTQLMQLQHGVHDLVYRPEDHVDSAVRIQAWWRAIIARRVVKVIRISQKLMVIGSQMSVAAIEVQARFRGFTTKRKFRDQIVRRMLETSRKQYREMELAMYCIIKIQQSYRSKLARRELTQLLNDAQREAQERASRHPSEVSVEDDSNQKMLVDTWMQATVAGAEAAGPGRAGVIIKQPPRHDWELDKIENAGHCLFYGVSSEDKLRHRIGGATALLMQQQLGIGRSRDDDITGAIIDNVAVSDVASLRDTLGDPWDVYPEGLTPGFVSGLSDDVWEKGGRAKSYENSLKIRGIHASASKRKKSKESCPRPCTKVVGQPPCNAVRRAQERQEQTSKSLVGDDSTGALAIASADTHPLFVNAPTLPPPNKRNSSRSARFSLPELADAEDEGSWDVLKVERQPVHRSDRRPRGEKMEQQWWNTLGVPYNGDIVSKKCKPGQVDHERVWCIAHALAGQLSEKLPALCAG